MKTLQNNFTTPEQSKRLLELGVPADSADCVHTYLGIRILPEGIVYSNYDWMVADGDNRTPCWSVGRLIEIENICSIPKIKEAGFHLMRTDFDDLIETMFISIRMKIEHGWIDFSKLEE